MWIEAADVYRITIVLERLHVLTFLMNSSVTASCRKRSATDEPLLNLMQAESEISKALSSKDPVQLADAIAKHKANLPESEVGSANTKLAELRQAAW